jgi:hypothetical protein
VKFKCRSLISKSSRSSSYSSSGKKTDAVNKLAKATRHDEYRETYGNVKCSKARDFRPEQALGSHETGHNGGFMITGFANKADHTLRIKRPWFQNTAEGPFSIWNSAYGPASMDVPAYQRGRPKLQKLGYAILPYCQSVGMDGSRMRSTYSAVLRRTASACGFLWAGNTCASRDHVDARNMQGDGGLLEILLGLYSCRLTVRQSHCRPRGPWKSFLP